ncbi:SusF/SusE family outer membrane protein [Pseudochryseolinea flava]|uniref:SusF first starch specific CBM domain-containing protein n=1 Tax=Pseudochryseolinea flava TaxID=2059302 RepID=A0A364XVI7_9BACT|nr:SusF/SusE family outer membrane protein [Pseudochryseolinea flava]RAV98139.1 hypothetical protein DQQ10_25055 [Pseudochryseolinea flava]
MKNLNDKSMAYTGRGTGVVFSCALLLFAIMISSCDKELDAPTIPPLETGTLSASKTTVVIDNTKPFDEAVSFTWTAKKNSHVVNKLILMSGEESDTVDVSTEVNKKFTNVEFNGILLDELDLTVGEVASVNVIVYSAVVAIADNNKTASSNTITLSVTPDNKVEPPPAYTKLWIVGNATPNGWNIGDPNVMVSDPLNAYQFKYNEVLKAGEFKIPVATGSWGADFYMPPVNHPAITSTSVKLTPGGTPDNKWIIDTPGAYKILLNISTIGFIKITPFTPYQNIYLIGDATTAGWDAANAIAMTKDGVDANVFTWTGELKSSGDGYFRFLTTKDLNQASFVAPAADASISTTQVAFTEDGTPANNFKVKVGEDGMYKITINQLKETITIIKQ